MVLPHNPIYFLTACFVVFTPLSATAAGSFFPLHVTNQSWLCGDITKPIQNKGKKDGVWIVLDKDQTVAIFATVGAPSPPKKDIWGDIHEFITFSILISAVFIVSSESTYQFWFKDACLGRRRQCS